MTQIGSALEQLHFWEHSSPLCGALSWAVAAAAVCVCVCVCACVLERTRGFSVPAAFSLEI